jgi:hypothetical protein
VKSTTRLPPLPTLDKPKETNMSSTSTYTFRMQENMERIFNLIEDRNPMLSDQKLYEQPENKEYQSKEQKKIRSEEARFAANCFYEYHNGREFQSNHWKKHWLDPEKKENHIQGMIAYKQSEKGKRQSKISAQKGRDNKTEEKISELKDIMKKVNNNQNKIKSASDKNKEHWKDPVFKEKMAKRKRGSNSKSLKEKWADPEWKAYMLAKRKEAKEKKKWITNFTVQSVMN